MPSFPSFVVAVRPRADRARRRWRLIRARASRRLRHLLLVPLVRGSTAVYFAATALVGFEGVEVIFGTFLLAPEFVPVALGVLAMIWLLRSRADRVRRRLRLAALRLRRRRDPLGCGGRGAALRSSGRCPQTGVVRVRRRRKQ
ncbi:hypothetical protein [Microbacterium resistens]